MRARMTIKTAWSEKVLGLYGLYMFVVGKWRPVGVFARTARTHLNPGDKAKIVSILWLNMRWKGEGYTLDQAKSLVDILPPSGKILIYESHEAWTSKHQFDPSLGFMR